MKKISTLLLILSFINNIGYSQSQNEFDLHCNKAELVILNDSLRFITRAIDAQLTVKRDLIIHNKNK